MRGLHLRLRDRPHDPNWLKVQRAARTRGDQYRSSPHHAHHSVEVHVFTPVVDEERWYVKAYFDPDSSAVFISVHKA